METKTITLSTLIPIIATLAFFGGVNLDSDNVFYCEARGVVMQCDSLSKYYGLENGKCINEAEGNRLCNTGWLEIQSEVKAENNLCVYIYE